jgi:acetyl esterase
MFDGRDITFLDSRRRASILAHRSIGAIMPKASKAAGHPAGVPDQAVTTTLASEIATDVSIDSIRFMFDQLAGLLNRRLPQVGAFHGRIEIDAPGRTIPVDVIVPVGPGPFPVLVYFHGGAWVAGNPASHRKLTFRFAESGFLVVSVDYRLAPEFPFPAAFDDCSAAVEWAAAHAHTFGGDPARLAVAGDSAGGNLAAAVAIDRAQRRRTSRICAAVLIYGVFDFAEVGGPMFTRALHDAYLGRSASAKLLTDPRVSPIHGAEWLPPTLILVGRQDPLYADSKSLHERLDAAGVRNEFVVAPRMPHGYIQMEFFADARRSIERIETFLAHELSISNRTRALRFWLRLIAAVGDSAAVVRDVIARATERLRAHLSHRKDA